MFSGAARPESVKESVPSRVVARLALTSRPQAFAVTRLASAPFSEKFTVPQTSVKGGTG